MCEFEVKVEVVIEGLAWSQYVGYEEGTIENFTPSLTSQFTTHMSTRTPSINFFHSARLSYKECYWTA